MNLLFFMLISAEWGALIRFVGAMSGLEAVV